MTTDEEVPAVGPLTQRFTRRGALRSEWIYGTGYQGPSSVDIFEALAARQPLWPGMRVLEIGSGLGGDAFRLASRYGVTVLGVDSSADMTRICLERAAEQGLAGVTFETGDVRTFNFGEAAMDLVWTRDCLMYLSPADKRLAWSRLYRALRPGGRIMVTDYCRGSAPSSEMFATLHRDSGFNLVTLDEYGSMLRSVGFSDVCVDDRTEDLRNSEVEERTRIVDERASFLAKFTPQEYRDLLQRWDTKITLSGRHELAWAVATAQKPHR